MSQAIVNLEQLRRFAARLKQFIDEMIGQLTTLHSQLAGLSQTWRDGEQENPHPLPRSMPRSRVVIIATAVALLFFAAVAFEAVTTRPVRGAMRTCSELFSVANRPGLTESERLDAARALCSKRYLATHALAVSPEGGIVGIPRNINMHFKAWREDHNIWVCTRDRVGPVYQFVHEDGRWKFDGPVALIDRWGRMVRTSELPVLAE